MRKNKSVLVSGAAGYIGSHMCHALSDQGYHPVGLDNLSTGFEESIMPGMDFHEANVGDEEKVLEIIKKYDIQDVIHFAGSVINTESLKEPGFYYTNNTFETLKFVSSCAKAGVKNFLFSSSAGVYGDHGNVVLKETYDCTPLTPYGASKLMSERMIADIANVYGFSYICLRYFNVVGANIAKNIGQRSWVSTHILKIICEALVGKRDSLSIYGTNYDTHDGTCIRDYVHVIDLAEAHLACLEYLQKGGKSENLNCGYGHGYSVRELIEKSFEVSGRNVPVLEEERRPGDPSILVASNDKIKELTGWQEKRNDLAEIISSALEWEERLLN